MRLFYSATSPFARKVLVLAHELGLADRIERVDINPWNDESLRAVNPFSQVPALVLADGTPLYDSAVICDYLNDLAGGEAYPKTGIARAKALRLEALGDGVCAAAVGRVREALRPAQERRIDQIARQSLAMEAALDVLEGLAPELGAHFGVGQIAVACTLEYLDLRFAAEDWRNGRPALMDWLISVDHRPSMKATQPPQTPPR